MPNDDDQQPMSVWHFGLVPAPCPRGDGDVAGSACAGPGPGDIASALADDARLPARRGA